MKKVYSVMCMLLLGIFLMGTVSAAEWDNSITYSKNDLKIELKNWFGLGTNYGSAELKSHSRVDETNFVSVGKDVVVMYYDFNFSQLYTNGIGDIEFIDMATGEYVTKSYKIVEWGSTTRDVYGWTKCGTTLKNGTAIDCSWEKTGSETYSDWIPYSSKNIPAKQVRLGLQVDVVPGETIDAIWTIGGKKVSRHASYTGVGEFGAVLQVNTGGGITDRQVKLYALTEGVLTGVKPGSSDSSCQDTNTSVWQNGVKLVEKAQACWKYDTAPQIVFDLADYLNPISASVDGGAFYVQMNKTGGSGTFGVVTSANEFNGTLFEYASQDNFGRHNSQSADPIFTFNQTTSGSTPVLTNVYPGNNSVLTTTNLNVSANASDAINLVNVSINVDGAFNQSNSSGFNATTYTFDLDLSDGVHDVIWNATNNGSTSTLLHTRLTVDTTAPDIQIHNQTNGSNSYAYTLPKNVYGNFTITDNIALDVCRVYNGTVNTTFSCSANVSLPTAEGTHTWTVYANDTGGNSNTAQTIFTVNYLRENATYETPVIEGTNTTIYFNLTSTEITTMSANLSWNGTTYVMGEYSNNGTYALFGRNLTLPYVDANDVINFSFNYLLNGDSLTSQEQYQQTVYNIPTLNVTTAACVDKALNFTLKDEVNFTSLSGTFEYNFAYGTSENNTASRVYGEITGASTFNVCVNSTINPTWELGEGQIFYTADGYVDRRYYLFEGTNLTNTTNEITLYDLFETDQTSFKLEVEDSSLNPYVDKFTTLVRWYPDLNEYNVVDMGLTDETGSTVIHVRTEDVDYRIGVYEQNGTLIKLADPIRMVCLVSPCTYTLKISPGDTDYTSFLNVDYTLTYNETTGIWSFVFTDTTQTTSEMNLTIYKLTGTSVYPVCSTAVSAYTGALTCNTSAYSGTLKAVAQRSASPPVTIAEKVVSIVTSAFSSSFGLWLSLLIAIPIIFIFAFMTPLGAVIGGVVALIPALYFGAINWAILGGVAVLGGIVLHFLRRT